MTPRALARSLKPFVLLLPLLLLGACLDFELGSSVSWSPSGGELAFLSAGRPWLFSMRTGRVAAVPVAPAARYDGLSWAPQGGRLALAAAGKVDVFASEGGGFRLETSYSLAASSAPPTFLSWHPSGRTLLAGRIHEDDAITAEVSLETGTVRELGTGLAFYGPGGDWLLWAGPAQLGRRTKVVFERQTAQGEPLPWPPGAAEALTQADMGPALSGSEPAGPLSPCFERSEKGRTEALCLDAAGAARSVGTLPVQGRVFPDSSRRLFAAVVEKDKEEPRLFVFDAQGRQRADGNHFLHAALGENPDGTVKGSAKVSRLAWSPDANWLAWVAEGRLCLWNWRNDEVRVIAPARP